MRTAFIATERIEIPAVVFVRFVLKSIIIKKINKWIFTFTLPKDPSENIQRITVIEVFVTSAEISGRNFCVYRWCNRLKKVFALIKAVDFRKIYNKNVDFCLNPSHVSQCFSVIRPNSLFKDRNLH